ncbi:hypothetical protein Tco_1022838 [Tanacetum coccineum]
MDLEEKLSSHDQIVNKIGQSIQTIHMFGKKPNNVYDPFLKVGLGYQNLECLKKAIAAQPKMYDCDRIHSTKLKIDSPDSKETLEDAEEKIPIEQTYFSTISISNVSSESSIEMSDLPSKKMPNENKLLQLFIKLDNAITTVIPMSVTLRRCSNEIKQEVREEVQEMLDIFESMEKKVKKQSQKDKKIQNEIDRLLEASLTREIRDSVLISVEKQKTEMLMCEQENISSDFKDVQANLLKRIKILEC